MKILVVNGPNLQLLGKREVTIYGTTTLEAIADTLICQARQWGWEMEFFQSNGEGELVGRIGDIVLHGGIDGVIINPGAYSHYSIALYDALRALSIPVIEVHLSNIAERESFRHNLVTAGACCGVIAGLGADSYCLALDALHRKLPTP